MSNLAAQTQSKPRVNFLGEISLETKGLTSAEAESLIKKFGPNELVADSGFKIVKLLLNQFTSPLVWILLIAAGISFWLKFTKDTYLIIGILAINAALGFWQEFKAERAVKALKKITVAKTRVIRDGQEIEIDNRNLVPGDLVVLFEGQTVPADGILLPDFTLEVNESALSGESLPVSKVGGDDEISMVYMGTLVTSGKAKALVTATGMRTRFGKIAASLKDVREEPTPFQKTIAKLARILAITAVLAALAVYLIGTAKGFAPFELFLVSASLAVAAVPEGLPAIVSLTLALGVQRMAKKYAIVRKMSAVEALGAITIICTDKTGTITTGQMKVRHIWVGGHEYPALTRVKGNIAPALKKLFTCAILGNSANLVLREDGDHAPYDIIGSPTDSALLVMVYEAGALESIRNHTKVIEEFGFDKTKKLVSAIYEENSEMGAVVRGAPERILERSQFYLRGDKIVALDSESKVRLTQTFEQYAGRGFRVIGFAEKKFSARSGSKMSVYTRDDAESNLVYLGFVALADPPRAEVKSALKKAKVAGVSTLMLTGDNILTAKAIGEEVGLLEKGDEVILGDHLNELTDAELDRYIGRVRIVARATPEQKLRVIQSLQRRKEIVAVTGDGINDSLALKQADVGVAMGITGTDVAKEASDIILADDRYATIVKAIEEGRRIDDNLTKVVRYLVAGNLSEVLVVLGGVLIANFSPLLPVQILWINIVTDALPAFALAAGPGDAHAMQRGPKAKDRNPLSTVGLKWVSTVAVIMTTATLAGFFTFLPQGQDEARTAAFTILVFGQMIMAFIVAWLHNGPTFNWQANRYLVLAVLGTLLVQSLLLFVPALRQAFHLVLP